MKKAKYLSLLIMIFILLTSCSAAPKYVPNGFTKSEEHFDKDGFQDYTDFCIYTYDSADCFINNSNYSIITDNDIENLKCYFDNFQGWMETEERLNEYSFDSNSISLGDYFHIETKEGEQIGGGKYAKYDNYDVYFFDIETMTLYYIHNNI